MSGTNEGNGKGGDGARPSFDEDLAAMPDRDPVDRLTRFTVSQFNDLLPAFKAQVTAIQLLTEQVSVLAAEVAALKAERAAPSDQVTLQ